VEYSIKMATVCWFDGDDSERSEVEVRAPPILETDGEGAVGEPQLGIWPGELKRQGYAA
jgi:hypothetical protein